jgi:hypothetical protein
MVKHQLEQRLQELKREFEAGQKALAELELRQSELRDTLLRISGAAQVLEEELQRADHDAPSGPDPSGPADLDEHLAQRVSP